MIIYKITNKKTGSTYVGQTRKKLCVRWKEHCKSTNGCRYLKHAIQKYGKDSFSIEVIAEYRALEDLNDAEEYFIDWYNCLAPNGYNLNSGGKSKLPSEETLKKQKLAKLGKHLSPSTEIKKGQRLSPKTEFKKGRTATNKKCVIDLESGFVFDSLTEASESLNITIGLLSWKLNKSKYNKRFKLIEGDL